MIGFLKSLSGHIVGFLFVLVLTFIVAAMFGSLIAPTVGAIVAIALTQFFFCAMYEIHCGDRKKIILALINISIASLLGFYNALAELYRGQSLQEILPFLVVYVLSNFLFFKILHRSNFV